MELSVWLKENGYQLWWSKIVRDQNFAKVEYIKGGHSYTLDEVVARWMKSKLKKK